MNKTCSIILHPSVSHYGRCEFWVPLLSLRSFWFECLASAVPLTPLTLSQTCAAPTCPIVSYGYTPGTQRLYISLRCHFTYVILITHIKLHYDYEPYEYNFLLSVNVKVVTYMCVYSVVSSFWLSLLYFKSFDKVYLN